MEILRELYWEAKRAPDTNTTMLKNPYRREFLKKKLLGKTKEERAAKIKLVDDYDAEHRLQVDKNLLGLQEVEDKKQEGLRKKRRENAAKRLALGFNDKGKEEVDDLILEDLEYKSTQYQKQIEEQKERKPVKMVTQVKGISKEEIQKLMLREEDKFKPI